jgi:hypothetical protein
MCARFLRRVGDSDLNIVEAPALVQEILES